MIKLGVFIIVLAAVGVVCGIVNICYNPDEYEYTDYRTGYRTDELEGGGRHD